MNNKSIASLLPCGIGYLPSFKIIEKIMDIDNSAFVIGGYIRKLLMGKESLDIDIVTAGDIKRLSMALAEEMGGTIVTFKKAGLIRVVSGEFSIDFSSLQGSLYYDLSKRDFTINAIAWSPSEGIVDFFKGITDIKRGIIRAVSPENLRDDPLRLLRAYRFVAEEGFKIHSETKRLIKRLKKTISTVAKERITSELFKILSSPHYRKALRDALADGLIPEIISINSDRLHNNVKSLSGLDRLISSIGSTGLDIPLDHEFSQGLTYRGLLRLERLLYNSNLSKNRLSLSRVIWKRLDSVTRALKTYRKGKGKLKSRTLFDLFYALKESSIDFSLLTGNKKIFLEAKRFLSMKDLIPGNRITEITGLRGRAIGDLLKELRYIQYLEERRAFSKDR